MKMLGQAWLYRIGNTLVRVENAFAWSGWCQERLRVNDETAHEAYGWFGTRRDFNGTDGENDSYGLSFVRKF